MNKRLYRINYCGNIEIGISCALSRAVAHYVSHVLRMGDGDEVLLFNNISGEFLCKLLHSGAGLIANPTQLLRKDAVEDETTLCFSLVKSSTTKNIFRQGTEMGVTCFAPFISSRSTSRDMNIDRMKAIIIEATEQCNRMNVPSIQPIIGIDALKEKVDSQKILCDETESTRVAADAFDNINSLNNVAIIIGPEGGFSQQELHYLGTFCERISLGPRILRVDTAVVTALAYINYHRQKLQKLP